MSRIAALSLLLALALFVGTGEQTQAQANLLRFEPTPKYVIPGSPNFTVQVWVEDVTTRDPCPWDDSGPCGLGAYKFEVSFDETKIDWISTANGTFLNSTGRPLYNCDSTPDHDPDNGIIGYQCTTTGYPPGEITPLGATGSGHLATIEFAPLVTDATIPLVFETAVLAEIDGTPIAGVSTQPGSVIIAPHADLDVDKTAPGAITAPGNIAYDVQVGNLGPSEAEAVTVVDTLSSNVAFVSADPRCTYNPSPTHTVTCDLGNMAASANTSVPITVSVAATKAGRTITNLVAVSSPTLEPDESNNDAQASTTVDLANVDIVKSAPEEVEKGVTDDYEIVVTSTGPSSAANVQVGDTLPADVTYVSASATAGTCYYLPSLRKVNCTLPEMPPSTSHTVTITVTFPDLDKLVCNQASVTWSQVPAGQTQSGSHCTTVGAADSDGDGCVDALEDYYGLDSGAWYDFYDVPVAAVADPDPNGKWNKVVDIGDVLAVLFYAFADPTPDVCGDNSNANGVDYDCDKGVDNNGDTVADIAPDGVADGLDYDRSAGLPDPDGSGPLVDPAGEPNGNIDISDVLAVLAQSFIVDCTIEPPP